MTQAPPAWMSRVSGLAPEEVPLVARTAHLSGERASAVLMLFGPDAGGDGETVLLTERAATLRNHPGQVSFPGGAADPGDDGPVGTALREAAEEVGLDRAHVRVQGLLPPLPLSVSNFRVTPVLAWSPAPIEARVVDAAEVGRVLLLPVSTLLDPANRFSSVHPLRGFDAPAFEVGDVYLWGFTAILLSELFDLAGLTRPWDVQDRRPVPDRFLTR